jgi:ankyrin repeat protein
MENLEEVSKTRFFGLLEDKMKNFHTGNSLKILLVALVFLFGCQSPEEKAYWMAKDNDFKNLKDFLLNKNKNFDINKLIKLNRLPGPRKTGFEFWREGMLHVACSEDGDPNVVKLLLDHGASPNLPDLFGNTPIFHVYFSKNPELAKKIAGLLIASGANLAHKNMDGDTLLHRHFNLSPEDNFKFIEFLLESGAPVNERDKNGQTPLHLVIINKIKFKKDFILLLIKYGADQKAKDSEGFTPADYAKDEEDKILLGRL